MEIVPLADLFDLAPQLARWHGAEWADLPPEWNEAAARPLPISVDTQPEHAAKPLLAH